VADRTSYTGMEAPVLISDIPERTTVQKDSTYLLNVGEGNQYHDMHGPIIQGKVPLSAGEGRETGLLGEIRVRAAAQAHVKTSAAANSASLPTIKIPLSVEGAAVDLTHHDGEAEAGHGDDEAADLRSPSCSPSKQISAVMREKSLQGAPAGLLGVHVGASAEAEHMQDVQLYLDREHAAEQRSKNEDQKPLTSSIIQFTRARACDGDPDESPEDDRRIKSVVTLTTSGKTDSVEILEKFEMDKIHVRCVGPNLKIFEARFFAEKVDHHDAIMLKGRGAASTTKLDPAHDCSPAPSPINEMVVGGDRIVAVKTNLKYRDAMPQSDAKKQQLRNHGHGLLPGNWVVSTPKKRKELQEVDRQLHEVKSPAPNTPLDKTRIAYLQMVKKRLQQLSKADLEKVAKLKTFSQRKRGLGKFGEKENSGSGSGGKVVGGGKNGVRMKDENKLLEQIMLEGEAAGAGSCVLDEAAQAKQTAKVVESDWKIIFDQEPTSRSPACSAARDGNFPLEKQHQLPAAGPFVDGDGAAVAAKSGGNKVSDTSREDFASENGENNPQLPSTSELIQPQFPAVASFFDREDVGRLLEEPGYFSRLALAEREALMEECLYFYGVGIDRLQKSFMAQNLFKHDFLLPEKDLVTVEAREKLLEEKKKEMPDAFRKFESGETRASMHSLVLAAMSDQIHPLCCEQYCDYLKRKEEENLSPRRKRIADVGSQFGCSPEEKKLSTDKLAEAEELEAEILLEQEKTEKKAVMKMEVEGEEEEVVLHFPGKKQLQFEDAEDLLTGGYGVGGQMHPSLMFAAGAAGGGLVGTQFGSMYLTPTRPDVAGKGKKGAAAAGFAVAKQEGYKSVQEILNEAMEMDAEDGDSDDSFAVMLKKDTNLFGGIAVGEEKGSNGKTPSAAGGKHQNSAANSKGGFKRGGVAAAEDGFGATKGSGKGAKEIAASTKERAGGKTAASLTSAGQGAGKKGLGGQQGAGSSWVGSSIAQLQPAKTMIPPPPPANNPPSAPAPGESTTTSKTSGTSAKSKGSGKSTSVETSKKSALYASFNGTAEDSDSNTALKRSQTVPEGRSREFVPGDAYWISPWGLEYSNQEFFSPTLVASNESGAPSAAHQPTLQHSDFWTWAGAHWASGNTAAHATGGNLNNNTTTSEDMSQLSQYSTANNRGDASTSMSLSETSGINLAHYGYPLHFPYDDTKSAPTLHAHVPGLGASSGSNGKKGGNGKGKEAAGKEALSVTTGTAVGRHVQYPHAASEAEQEHQRQGQGQAAPYSKAAGGGAVASDLFAQHCFYPPFDTRNPNPDFRDADEVLEYARCYWDPDYAALAAAREKGNPIVPNSDYERRKSEVVSAQDGYYWAPFASVFAGEAHYLSASAGVTAGSGGTAGKGKPAAAHKAGLGTSKDGGIYRGHQQQLNTKGAAKGAAKGLCISSAASAGKRGNGASGLRLPPGAISHHVYPASTQPTPTHCKKFPAGGAVPSTGAAHADANAYSYEHNYATTKPRSHTTMSNYSFNSSKPNSISPNKKTLRRHLTNQSAKSEYTVASGVTTCPSVHVQLPKQPPAPKEDNMRVLRKAILAYFTKYELEEAILDNVCRDSDVKAAWKKIGRVPLWKLVKQFPRDMNQRQMADGSWKLWLLANPVENEGSPVVGEPARCELLLEGAAGGAYDLGRNGVVLPVQSDESPVVACSSVAGLSPAAAKLAVPLNLPSPIAKTRSERAGESAELEPTLMGGSLSVNLRMEEDRGDVDMDDAEQVLVEGDEKGRSHMTVAGAGSGATATAGECVLM